MICNQESLACITHAQSQSVSYFRENWCSTVDLPPPCWVRDSRPPLTLNKRGIQEGRSVKFGSGSDQVGGGPTDDGATSIAASFGRIRLSGSPAQCRAAAEYALDYCRRVRDSPSTSLHWRIPLTSKRFSGAIGR